MSKKETLRRRVRNLLRSEGDRALIDAGFTYESGALTPEGRKVVLDLLFRDLEGVKPRVVELAQKLLKKS